MSAKAKLRRMKVATLIFDYSIYPRQKVDDFHVKELAESYRAGADIPPIKVEAKSLRIVDGFHRANAMRRIHEEWAEIDVLLQEYSSEAEMYEDAMRLNASHGRNLTSYDKAHCILRAREFGIQDELIANCLNITKDRFATLIQERYTATGDVLKRTVGHFAQKEITNEQRQMIPKAGGMDQLFYINQVVALVDTDSIDWSRDKVRNALMRLRDLLTEKLK